MDYKLIKKFHIDNGELDGVPPQQCFVLGYELATIDHLLTLPAAFEKPVNAENHARVTQACQAAKRDFTLAWMANDVSENWLWLTVQGQETTKTDTSTDAG